MYSLSLTVMYHFNIIQCVVQLYIRDGANWRLAGPGGVQSSELALKPATANSILADYIAEEREQHVIDFDEHLDDVSK